MKRSKPRHLTKILTLSLLVASQSTYAQSFPENLQGAWCIPGEGATFFTDPKSAQMGDIQCKLLSTQPTQQGIKARLICTNWTGKYVERMSLDISNGNLRISNDSAIRRKCP
jgi:hypothetical protein